MKGPTAVHRSSCGTTGVPARATRGCRENGGDEPATHALHRESYDMRSGYSKGAQGMRGSSHGFWSSSSCPRVLIDELATRHPGCVGSTARRYIQYRKRHAMRDSIDGCASHTVRKARPIVGNRLFCFRNVSRQPSAACASAPANRLHIEKATARYTREEHFRSDIGRAFRRRKPIRATRDLRRRSVIARFFCSTRAVGLHLARIRPAIAASVRSARVGDTRVKPKFMLGPRGLGLITTAMTGAAGYVPSNSVLRRCTTSRIGGAPNSRLYSRLNCDALS